MVNNHDLKDDPDFWQWYGLPQFNLRMFILKPSLFAKLTFPRPEILFMVAEWLERRIEIHGM